MKRLAFIFAIFLLAGSTMGQVRLRAFNAERDGSAVVLQWETEEEVGASKFELFRKSGQSGEFVLVGSADAHGANLQYTIRDTNVYKSPEELIDYKLEVVLGSGLRIQLAELKVNYTPTAIRRSWGSIKAMFQN